MKRKLLSLGVIAAIFGTMLAGCGAANESSTSGTDNMSGESTAAATKADGASTEAPATAMKGMITVVTRESGSGTRSAFIELTGVQGKDAGGNKVDNTTVEAVEVNKTDVMLTQVAGNERAIGYISLGSLNDTVKALDIDGTAATSENVKNKSYKVSRPFEIATKGEATGLSKDFIAYIMSADGQKIITENHYIAIDDAAKDFTSDNSTGKIVVGGSSSVTPVMEKLAEAYKLINTAATIEIQQSDSSAGIKGAVDGTVDIGMASRELTADEKAALTNTTIALDGIAVIVNKANSTSGITTALVKDIYTGATTDWADVK